MITNPFHSTRAIEQGFTLVETLVAIAILMIAIALPFYTLQQAITASRVARDQVIASSLAQEGAEHVYYIRNNNYLYFKQNGSYPSGGGGWLAGLTPCLTTTSPGVGCTVDPAQNSISACASGGCSALRMNSSMLYTQSVTGTSATPFTRTVRIESLNANAARVTVTVSWTTGVRTYSTTVTETLYNWL